jgi:hypothetical protein
MWNVWETGEIHTGFFLVGGDLRESDHLEDLGVDGENSIKMDNQEVGWGGLDWIGLGRDRDRWRAFVNSVMNLRVL